MIQELTRRVNYDLKINQSIYTTNLELPNKLSLQIIFIVLLMLGK